MADTVKLAFVGCGVISDRHVRGCKTLFAHGCREFEVVACCDVRQESAEQRANEIAAFQGKKPVVFTAVDDLIRSGIAQAVDLLIPHWLHHSVAISLMNAGLHVMVEKPVGITIQASRRMIEVAQQKGLVLATAEQIRRGPYPRACAWAINTKKLIGDVRLVTIQRAGKGGGKGPRFDAPSMKWRGVKLLGGGAGIIDGGAHTADMMQVLYGDVDQAYCTMSTVQNCLIQGAPVLGDVYSDVEDSWYATICFEGGPTISWISTRTFLGEPSSFAIHYGTKGTIKDLGDFTHLFYAGGEAVLDDGTTVSRDEILAEYMASLTSEQKERLFPYGLTDEQVVGQAIEIWDFCNAIATGRKPEMDGLDGLRAKALCETLYESATAGTMVKFDDVLEGRIDAYQKPINDFWKI
jgi:UDP-N-acetyl-2-amino-2-deoxyglucuronate dehydrogenase